MRNSYLFALIVFSLIYLASLTSSAIQVGAQPLYYNTSILPQCTYGCINNSKPQASAVDVLFSVNFTNTTSGNLNYWIFGFNQSGSFVNDSDASKNTTQFWQNQSGVANATIGNGTLVKGNFKSLIANDGDITVVDSKIIAGDSTPVLDINSSVLINPNMTTSTGCTASGCPPAAGAWANYTMAAGGLTACNAATTTNKWQGTGTNGYSEILNTSCKSNSNSDRGSQILWNQTFNVNSTLLNATLNLNTSTTAVTATGTLFYSREVWLRNATYATRLYRNVTTGVNAREAIETITICGSNVDCGGNLSATGNYNITLNTTIGLTNTNDFIDAYWDDVQLTFNVSASVTGASTYSTSINFTSNQINATDVPIAQISSISTNLDWLSNSTHGYTYDIWNYSDNGWDVLSSGANPSTLSTTNVILTNGSSNFAASYFNSSGYMLTRLHIDDDTNPFNITSDYFNYTVYPSWKLANRTYETQQSDAGKHIYGIFYANDTSGNWNKTELILMNVSAPYPYNPKLQVGVSPQVTGTFIGQRPSLLNLLTSSAATRLTAFFRSIPNVNSFLVSLLNTRMLSFTRQVTSMLLTSTRTIAGKVVSTVNVLTAGVSASTGRMLIGIRSLTSAMSFMFSNTQLVSLARSLIQQLSVNAISAAISTFSRAAFSSLSFNNIVTAVFKVGSTLSERTANLAVTFADDLSRILSLGRVASQQLSTTNLVSTLAGFGRSISQMLSASNILSRLQILSKTIQQSISFNALTASLSGTARTVSQSFSSSTLVSNLFAFARSASQTFAQNTLASRIIFVMKTISQSTSFAAISARIATFGRLVSSSLSFSSAITAVFTHPGTINNGIASLAVSFTGSTSRILSLSRPIVQQFNLSVLTQSIASYGRILAQNIFVNVAAARTAILGRLAPLSFNFNVATSTASGALRIASQPFTSSAAIGNLLSLSRTLTQALDFGAFTSRMTSVMQAVSQAFSFGTISARMSTFGRIVASPLSLVSSLASVVTNIGNISNASVSLALSFASSVSRTLSFAKAITQPLTFNAMTQAISSIMRTVIQPLTTNAFFTDLSRAAKFFRHAILRDFDFGVGVQSEVKTFRTAFQSFTSSLAITNIFGELRIVSQTFSLNNVVTTTQSLFKSISQTLSLTTLATRIFSTSRAIMQTIGFNTIISTFNIFSRFSAIATSLSTGAIRVFSAVVNVFLQTLQGISGFRILFQGQIGNFGETTTTTTTTPTGTVTVTVGVPSGGGGGGGGGVVSGGGIIAPPAKIDLSFNPQEIGFRLNPGERQSIGLTITNNGSSDASITIAPSSEISGFVTVDRSSLTVKAKSQATVNVNIAIPGSAAEDVFVGHLDVNAANVVYRIKTSIVILSQAQNLLDVKVNVLNSFKKVLAGNEVIGSIAIYNLGQSGRVDVNLTYGVRNASLTKEFKETLAVETQVSLARQVAVPKEFSPGTYEFYAIASYSNSTAESYDTFDVLPSAPAGIISLPVIAFSTVIVTIIIISLAVVYRRKSVFENIARVRKSLSGEEKPAYGTYETLKKKWAYENLKRKWTAGSMERERAFEDLKRKWIKESLEKVKKTLGG